MLAIYVTHSDDPGVSRQRIHRGRLPTQSQRGATIMPQKATASKPRPMSIPAAAERLGVSDKTVRRLISEGKLPAYRIGAKTIRLRPEDVDALFVPVPTPTV